MHHTRRVFFVFSVATFSKKGFVEHNIMIIDDNSIC